MNARKSLFLHRLAVAACLLISAACLFLVSKTGANFGRTDWIYQGKPGPWGSLECTHIAVEMPETFVSLEEVKNIHAHWFFQDYTREQTLSLFHSAGVTQTEFKLLQDSKWETDSRGIWITPPDELVLSLSQTAREKIYTVLAKFPENAAQTSPFSYRPELLPGLLKRSGLKDSTIKQFKKALYRHKGLLLFSDADIVVNQLPDENEKLRFLKTISRVSTLLVKLSINENSDIDQLVDYWSYGGRKKDIRSLLESMAAVPGGAKIDVAHLLPGFARKRIYSYPNPESLTLTNQHCHWTSMNFLAENPDDQFSDNQIVQKTVQTDFIPVTDNPQLGDVVFFLEADGGVVHSATYIADDIVFTKNGAAANRPWIYMQLKDLRACYEHPGAPLNLVICRRRML